jgi:hypothetical protein
MGDTGSRRRARRRDEGSRRRRAAGLSAGRVRALAVVLAVPLVGLTGACTAGPRPAAGAGSPTVTGGETASPGRPSLPPSPVPPGPRPGRVPAGGPVPAGFAAWSVTFVSDRQAYLLGDAPCRRAPCTSVVRTLDGGRSWRGVPAPRASLPSTRISAPSSAATVRELRFATGRDGYAFGGGLWTTHNGARSWRRLNLGVVRDLATDGRTVYAVVADCAAGAGSCRGVRLLTSPVSADAFRPVAGLEPGGGAGADGAVSTGGGTTVATLAGAVYVRRGSGGWTRAADPCWPLGGPVVAPASGSTLTAYCAEGAAGSVYLTIRQSTDLGGHWSAVAGGALRLPNSVTALTAGSASVLAAAAASPDLGGGLSVSRDGGRTWAAAPLPRTGDGWRYVGARSATALVALPDPPAAVLWTSGTAGRTWTAHPIR